MNPDRQAFIDAILAEPDDDALRLAFSDWLEERGDPYGEFIRVQCGLAMMTPCPDGDGAGGWRNSTCSYCRLHRREQELLRPDGGIETMWARPEWSNGVVGLFLVKGSGGYSYRRGFVESVTLTAAAWIEHGDAILACQPVQEVELTTVPQVDFTEAGSIGLVVWLGRSYQEVGTPFKSVVFVSQDRIMSQTWAQMEQDVVLKLLHQNWLQVKRWYLSVERDPVVYGNPDAARPLGVIHA